jgi:ankyrin repeat protein
MTGLVDLLVAIATGDRPRVQAVLDSAPSLVTARVARPDEFFLADIRVQLYEGDTALHVAAVAYDIETVRDLVARGADVLACNRRGAQPLHSATAAETGAANRNPDGQRAVIEFLVGAGADPNATARGGVTPLHRAVRNRCSVAVDALLRAGADPRLANDHGSTPADLARWTTGRGGTGSELAKAEQQAIIDALRRCVS